MYLSVIIPAYNEEKRITNTLKETNKYLSRQSYDYEIIVVNDGSKDKTAEVVECLRPDLKHLRLIDNKKNHGKGYVVKQGLLDAKGKYRIFTDADNSTSIDQIEKMWPEFEKGYEVVIGSRDIKGSVIAVPQSRWRIMLGNVFNLIVQLVSGLLGIWDTQCGFKGFTKKTVEDIFPKCKINRFAFDVEALVLAKKMGYKIKEIPVVWINSPESTVGFKSMVKMLLEVFQIRWNLISKRYG
ncbi:glycosyltransferase family 2 protein [Candidatus Parcubacteria bacterium]|nr:glycosyltransferase family 2 protein [Candidatus Parcubacteria bacterium]